jgi:heat shock protein HslJ
MKKNFTILFLMTILLSACAGASPTVSLNETSWELISYGDIDNPMPALKDIATTITFGAEGNLHGDVGCNNFSGSYEISGNKIITGPMMSTMMACEAPQMDQESAVLMLLSGTLAFEADGDMLTLFSEDGNSTVHLMRAEN